MLLLALLHFAPFFPSQVLGDRSIKYKYVNPNSLFVATVTPGEEVGADASASRLTTYILDTVTGALLHKAVHLGAAAPVKAVWSENWVVYQYFNAVEQRCGSLQRCCSSLL